MFKTVLMSAVALPVLFGSVVVPKATALPNSLLSNSFAPVVPQAGNFATQMAIARQQTTPNDERTGEDCHWLGTCAVEGVDRWK